MSKKKIIIIVVSLLIVAGLAFSGVVSQNSPSSPTETPSSRSVFPFEKGTLNYKSFAQLVIPANTVIKTIEVNSVSTVTISSGEDIVATTGVVDQRDAQSVKYHIVVSHEGVTTEYIRVDDEIVSRVVVADEEDDENSWQKVEEESIPYGVTTSTDFFRGFNVENNPVRVLKYEGADSIGHKFSMSVDLNKMLEVPTTEQLLGDAEIDFWLDEELKMLKQETRIENKSGTSVLVNEQKGFNQELEIVLPETS